MCQALNTLNEAFFKGGNLLAFHTGRSNAGGDKALQEGKDNRDWQQSQYGHRQHKVPLDLQVTLEGVKTNLESEDLGLAEHNERPEEVVPAPHHREDCQYSQCRAGQR